MEKITLDKESPKVAKLIEEFFAAILLAAGLNRLFARRGMLPAEVVESVLPLTGARKLSKTLKALQANAEFMAFAASALKELYAGADFMEQAIYVELPKKGGFYVWLVADDHKPSPASYTVVTYRILVTQVLQRPSAGEGYTLCSCTCHYAHR